MFVKENSLCVNVVFIVCVIFRSALFHGSELLETSLAFQQKLKK